jgi:type I restriction enzyme S subunit
MRSELSSGWIKSQLCNLAADKPFAIVDGPFGTQLHHDEYVSDGVPVVRIVNLSYDGRFLNDDLVFITERKAEELSRSTVNPNDIIIAKTGATIGKLGMFPVSYERGIIASSCLKITPNSNLINPKYLLHLLTSEYGQRAIVNGAIGSTRATINITPFGKIEVYHPIDTNEQRRIVEIFDTISDAIRKTEAVIAKLRQVRAGLLHDLLTRGLDENGEIRDPRFNPNQFKDSQLGKIPNSWEVKEIKDCYSVPSRNGLYKKVSSYGFGHRMIHMPQMFKSAIVEPNEAVRVDVTPEELQRYALEEGDLLFARRSLTLEGAGLCSIVPELKEPVTFESSIIRVRLDRRKILSHFAVEFLRSPKGYLLRRPFIRQVAVSGVSSEDVGQFLLPCPEPNEQERILSLLEIYDQALSLFEKKLVKLNSIKEGLISDLLSGRVRVPEGII